MGLSAIGQKALEQEQEKAKRPGLSPIGMKALEQEQSFNLFGTRDMPEMGVGNSTSPVPTGPGTVDLARGFGQGMARGYAASGQFMAKQFGLASGDEVDPNEYFGRGETAGKVGRAVFGTDQKFTATSEDEELLDMIGLEGGSATSGGRLTVLLAGLDLFTGGAIKGLKGAVTVLKNADNVEDAFKVMKNIGFDDDIARDYASVFAKTKDSKVIMRGLESAMELQNTTKVVSKSPLRVVDNSEPMTVGGKVFGDEVQTLRTATTRLFDDVPLEKMTAELTQIRTMLKRNETPSLDDFGRAISVLEDAGVKTDSIRASFDDLSATVKVEPQRFSTEAVEVPKVAGKVDEVVKNPVPELSLPDGSEIYYRGLSRAEDAASDVKSGSLTRYAKEDTDLHFTKDYDEALRYAKGDANAVVEFRLTPDQVKNVSYSGDLAFYMPEQIVGDALKVSDAKIAKSKSFPARLDEVADPLREKLGMLSVQVQERFGKSAVTRSKAEKFAQHESKVFNEIYRYAEEARHIADNQDGVGDMVQSMPKWVPEDLRSPLLFERVTDMLRKGEIPSLHGTPEMRLYTEMVDETARRAGILSKTAKQAVSPETAIVQSMRERTGDVPAYPVDGVKPGKEVADSLEAEIASPDLANEEYLKYGATQFAVDTKTEASLKMVRLDFEGLQDTSKFMSVARDVYRNSEKVFGEFWPKIKKEVFDPFDAAKGHMVREERHLTDSLQSEIIEKLGITRKSKESAAVMDYGEKMKSYDDLVKEFGEQKADNIVTAAKWFRGEYDRMLDEVNAVRARIYPGQENKLIPKRQNYFRHYEEMSQNWGGLKNAFEDPGLSNMSPALLELGEKGTGAKSKWLSFAQKRFGSKTERDAVGGFLNYVPNFAYAKHIDPQTARIRTFVKMLTDMTEKSKNLNNYIEGMRKWGDDLAGLANFVDRFAEHAPGGRRGLDILDWANKRAKRNAILGNIGTALSQSFNVPNGISVARAHSVRGLTRSFGDIVHYGDEGTAVAWKDSDFINERYKNSMYDKFSVGFFEKSSDMAGWLISILDEAGTKFIWNSMYEKALAEGVANPVKYADDLTRKTVAGRGVGEVPLVQKSKVFQMVAPFQLEVTNVWHVLGDKDPHKIRQIATLFGAMWIWNQAAEEITGSDVTMDPVQAFYDSYQIAVSEATIKEKGVKVTGRVLGETLSGLPMGNYLGAAFAGVSGMDEKAREEFFSENGDPVRYGTIPLLYRAATNPLFGLLPAWGGRQLEKTLGGIDALANGEVRDAEGAPLMDVKPGVAGVLQNILFGKWAPNIRYEKELEKEMMSLYKENEALISSADEVDAKLAQQNVDDLNDKMWPIYKRVSAEGRAETEKRKVREMAPTLRVVDGLLSEKKDDEAQKIVEAMTPEEYKIYQIARKNERAEEDERDKESVIKEALDYAYAFGTNPIQAFNIVFKNHEIIEDVKGGAFTGVVRTRRITKEESEAIKKDLGHTKGDSLILEHKLPLGLGGSNQITNLELVPADKHDSWTPVEVYLIEAMKDRKIKWQEAQELILRHKGYEGEPVTFEDIKRIVEGQ